MILLPPPLFPLAPPLARADDFLADGGNLANSEVDLEVLALALIYKDVLFRQKCCLHRRVIWLPLFELHKH